MPLHFTEAELADRRARTCAAMAEAGLDGLLCFRQESMFWLTGYDTFGYVYFQCLYLGADGTMTLLTRAPDLRQAQQTSVIGDIRIWIDRPDAGPAVAQHLPQAWEAYDSEAALRALDASRLVCRGLIKSKCAPGRRGTKRSRLPSRALSAAMHLCA